MNLFELQAELRHFAAERDWQAFHTPKNLSTALLVEAAELAEIFQWMTPQESQAAHLNPPDQQRIGAEVADVLLYLLQLADHSAIELERAVRDKLAVNGQRFPAKRQIARVSPARAAVPGTHVLLDFENVQPSDAELRALVPDAAQVWVFHGPHQRQVAQRFASFGEHATAVPISQSGKNALDFHLSFYMGYIASRSPAAKMVVLANDKGYEPMLEHARAMGFEVRRLAFSKPKPAAKKAAVKKSAVVAAVAAVAVPKKAPVKAAAVAKPVVKTALPKPTPSRAASVKRVSAKPLPAKPARTPARTPAPTRQSAAKVPLVKPVAPAPEKKKAAAVKAVPKPKVAPPKAVSASRQSGLSSLSNDDFRKLTANLRKMGEKRPVKPASLRGALKSFLSAETGASSIEAAFSRLLAEGVIAVGAGNKLSYPGFDQAVG